MAQPPPDSNKKKAKRRKLVKPFEEKKWESDRPKPVVSAYVWGDHSAQDIAFYVDWHGRHPFCITPRKLGKDEQPEPNEIYDENDPTMVYSRVKPRGETRQTTTAENCPPMFKPKFFGANAQFDEVSVVTHRDYQKNGKWTTKTIVGGGDSIGSVDGSLSIDTFEDLASQGSLQAGTVETICAKSVSDYMEESHCAAFESKLAEIARAKEEYKKAAAEQAAAKRAAEEKFKKEELERLYVSQRWGRIAKTKVGPWDDKRTDTQYTKDGTLLVEFERDQLDKCINAALAKYKVELDEKARGAAELAKLNAAKEARLAAIAAQAEAAAAASEASGENSVMPFGEGDQLDDDSASVQSMSTLGTGGIPALQLQLPPPGMDMPSPAKSSGKSGKRKKRGKSSKLVPVDENGADSTGNIAAVSTKRPVLSETVAVDEVTRSLLKYEAMKEKLGGDEKVDALSEGWVSYANVIRKKLKAKTNFLDFSTDLYDACDRGQVAKVNAMLVTGQGNANLLVNEEPLLVVIFMKAILQDQLFGWLTEDIKEPSDRRKLTGVLDALIKFGADINNLEASDGMAVIHQACMIGNSKMLKWVMKQKNAKISLYSRRDRMTPLMYAAKFGHVECLAALMLSRQSSMRYLNSIDKDPASGRAALHYAANYGQTLAAMFLLRIGSDKIMQDANGKHPGKLALDSGYFPTAQMILGFNKDKVDVGPVFGYLSGDKEEDVATKLGAALQSALDVGGKVLGALSDGIGSLFGTRTSSVGIAETKNKFDSHFETTAQSTAGTPQIADGKA